MGVGVDAVSGRGVRKIEMMGWRYIMGHNKRNYGPLIKAILNFFLRAGPVSLDAE